MNFYSMMNAPVLQMYLESMYEYSDIHRVQNRSDQWVKIFLILVKISQSYIKF